MLLVQPERVLLGGEVVLLEGRLELLSSSGEQVVEDHRGRKVLNMRAVSHQI